MRTLRMGNMVQTDGRDTIANRSKEMDELLERIEGGLTTRILFDRGNGTVQLYTSDGKHEEYVLIVPDNVKDAYEHPMTYVERPDLFFSDN
jgi:hypothetical protein